MASSFDFRALNRYFSPQASDDLNRFLEKLPHNAGNAVLIAAGIAWASAAALGLFSMMQTQELTKLKGDLQASEALQPVVPVLTMVDVADAEVKALVENMKAVYAGLLISSNGSTLTIQSKDTANFAQFREAMGQVSNGGMNWKVTVESFCVGRECGQNSLEAKLKIQKMQIDKPSGG